jgi:hypothetical protein
MSKGRSSITPGSGTLDTGSSLVYVPSFAERLETNVCSRVVLSGGTLCFAVVGMLALPIVCGFVEMEHYTSQVALFLMVLLIALTSFMGCGLWVTKSARSAREVGTASLAIFIMCIVMFMHWRTGLSGGTIFASKGEREISLGVVVGAPIFFLLLQFMFSPGSRGDRVEMGHFYLMAAHLICYAIVIVLVGMQWWKQLLEPTPFHPSFGWQAPIVHSFLPSNLCQTAIEPVGMSNIYRYKFCDEALHAASVAPCPAPAPPEHGAAGTCVGTFASGSTCQPTCPARRTALAAAWSQPPAFRTATRRRLRPTASWATALGACRAGQPASQRAARASPLLARPPALRAR